MLSKIKLIFLFSVLISSLSTIAASELSRTTIIFSDEARQDTIRKEKKINTQPDSLFILADTLLKNTFIPLDSSKKILDSLQQPGIVTDSLTLSQQLSEVKDTTDFVLDSTQIVLDSSLVQYFTSSIDSFALGKMHNDTMNLFGIQNFDPNYSAGHYYASLGNTGLPAKSLLFKPQVSEGFNYVNSPLDLYTFADQDVRYFKIFQPFTEVFYVMGPKKENTFRVTHTQNITRGLTVGINFKFINAPGIYSRQSSDHKNLYVTARYSNRNGRYGFIANYIHNKLVVEENGGLKTDSAFIYSLETNRALIAVNLQDAQNTYKTGSVYFNQYFNIGRPPYIETDTTGQKIRHTGTRLGQLSHTLSVDRKSFTFSDNNTDDIVFYNYLDPALNEEASNDSTKILKVENQIKWTNLGYEIKPLGKKKLYLSFALKHQYIEVSDTSITVQKFHELIPNFTISAFLLKNLRLNIDGFYVTGNHNDGDFALNAHINKLLGSQNRNFGQLDFRASYAKQSPALFYNQYNGNYLRWENDFLAEKYLTFQTTYTFKGIKAGIIYQKIKNYIFINKFVHPEQTDVDQRILSATLDFRHSFKDFGLDAHLIYQKPKRDTLLRVPELMGSISVTYTKGLFKNATTIQPGIEVFYSTAYFADAYMPAIRSFYLQNLNKIGGAVYADVYFNFTIKNTMFFLKYQHFNAALTGYNYFLVPHYPMPDYAIKFGIIWKFMN